MKIKTVIVMYLLVVTMLSPESAEGPGWGAGATRMRQRYRHAESSQQSAFRVVSGDGMNVQQSVCNKNVNINIDVNADWILLPNSSSPSSFWRSISLTDIGNETKSCCWKSANVTNLTRCDALNNNSNSNNNSNPTPPPLCVISADVNATNATLSGLCAVWDPSLQCVLNRTTGPYNCPAGYRPSGDPCVRDCVRCLPECPSDSLPSADPCDGCVSCLCSSSAALSAVLTVLSTAPQLLSCQTLVPAVALQTGLLPSSFCQLLEPPSFDLSNTRQMLLGVYRSSVAYPLPLVSRIVAISESSGSSFIITEALVTGTQTPHITVSSANCLSTDLFLSFCVILFISNLDPFFSFR